MSPLEPETQEILCALYDGELEGFAAAQKHPIAMDVLIERGLVAPTEKNPYSVTERGRGEVERAIYRWAAKKLLSSLPEASYDGDARKTVKGLLIKSFSIDLDFP